MAPGLPDDEATPADRRAAQVRELLAPGAAGVRFSPFARLTDGVPIGYLAHPVFPPLPGLGALPAAAAAAAADAAGLRPELDAACWRAVAAAGEPPGGRLLALGVAAQTLARWSPDELAPVPHQRLVLAVANADAVDPDALRRRLAPWVARGAMVAISDSGRGAAALELVSALRPDFVLVPPSLVGGAARDSGRAFVRALTALARDVGARVLADGIERAEQWRALLDAGVDLGAGALFGAAGPAWPPATSVWPAGPAPASRGASGDGARGDRLERDLAAATTAREAATVAVEHLDHDGRLPSVYLEQDGRLRCQAQRGYWQVLDGIPLSTGVMTRVLRTGEVSIIQDVAAAPEYLAAGAGVQAEVCFPLRVAGTVVGVLNVESPTAFDVAAIAAVERCAALLSARLDALGPPPMSAAQRLARAAARISALADAEAIIAEAMSGALAVSGMESALVAGQRADGVFAARGATGPLAEALTAVDAASLADIAGFARLGSSSYTHGEPGARGWSGHDTLRRTGARAVVVLPLTVAQRPGMLVLADRAGRVPTDHIELLELLATHAAAALTTAEAMTELRIRAETDPLTGLGHHGAFHAALPERRARMAPHRRLTVVACDVDGFKARNDAGGHQGGDEALRAIAAILRAAAGERGAAFRVGGDEFAILVDVRGEAEAHELAAHVGALVAERVGLTLSIGVALATPGETDAALVARADAAAYAIKRGGRNGVAVARPPARTPAARA